MRIVLILLLIFTQNLYSQKLINKHNLKGTWFTANDDSTFFKSDTVILFKNTNKEIRDDIRQRQKSYIEPKADLTKSNSYVSLFFRRKGELHISNFEYNSGVSRAWHPLNWSISGNYLTIVNSTFNFKFKILEVTESEFNHMISNSPVEEFISLSTQTLIVLRVN
jgi:hypothetical protein